MWQKSYRDYPPDSPLKKERIEPSKGLIGCEMHEYNGWGNSLHIPKPRKWGLLASMKRALSSLFGKHP